MPYSRNCLLLTLLTLGACSSSEPTYDNDSFVANGDSTPLLPSEELQAQEASEAATVRSQRNALMAEAYVDLGNDAFERGDYKGSAAQYAKASLLDPSNVMARDGSRRSQSAMAGGSYDIDSSENVLQTAQARATANRIRIEGLVRDGDQAMSQGQYAKAVDYYQIAKQAVDYNPNLAVGALDGTLVHSKFEQAVSARNDLESSQRSNMAAAAASEAAELQTERVNYRNNLISTHLSEANEHFLSGFPSKSVSTLDTLLRIDPGNTDALALRAVALETAHQQRAAKTSSDFREQWQRTFEDLRHSAMPAASHFAFDEDYYNAVVSKRTSLDSAGDVKELDATTVKINSQLDSTMITPSFDNSLEEIVPNLSAFAGVNFFITRAVQDDVDEDLKMIRINFKNPLPISRVLRIMEDVMGGEVKFVVRNGAVYVVTAEEADTESVTRQYEVRDIVNSIKDFPLPDYNLAPSGGIEPSEEELPESEATVLTADDLQTTIEESIEPDSWDGELHSLSIENGTLIVHHRPEVLDEIAQMLEDLRAPANIMVYIKVRFLLVEDSFLEDVGVDFRGLGNDATSGVPGDVGSINTVFNDFGDSTNYGSPGAPGVLGTGQDVGAAFAEAGEDILIIGRTEQLYDSQLGDSDFEASGGLAMQYAWLDDTELQMILRAVKKSKRSETVIEPSLMVHNTARANLVVANQVSYISDFDVEIASSASIADPIVSVANDGVFLDVRPVVTADRRFVWIDVRPTVANLKRPIATLQTSLGTGSPVNLMLPELELQKVRTRALVPDGGTLLLGGMKTVKEKTLESGVPFLSDIPILSFFFSRKGSYETYQKLLILLTANIILPEEYEPTVLPSNL
ncbi:MAG: type II secretory pathway component GspD/PulD (secretin)/tetratricopeptide (TPR) repeat protein [Myxococcota bacterium]|jgi:type II secretory pathway component GspD/PulD (secretin)/tetratricopeptide (TPR) repeat protein